MASPLGSSHSSPPLNHRTSRSTQRRSYGSRRRIAGVSVASSRRPPAVITSSRPRGLSSGRITIAADGSDVVYLAIYASGCRPTDPATASVTKFRVRPTSGRRASPPHRTGPSGLPRPPRATSRTSTTGAITETKVVKDSDVRHHRRRQRQPVVHHDVREQDRHRATAVAGTARG